MLEDQVYDWHNYQRLSYSVGGTFRKNVWGKIWMLNFGYSQYMYYPDLYDNVNSGTAWARVVASF
jgi:hypothetical protein